MTARVLNPVVLTELCKIRHSPSSGNRNPCGRNLDRIKRDLFGSVNPIETTKIFNEEIEKHQEKAMKKWGFDFCSGSPLSNGSQFVWERVPFNDFVPEMYTLSRAAHVRPLEAHEDIANNYDILMDERAERENIINFTQSSLTSSPASSTSSNDDFCNDYHNESITFKVPPPITIAANIETATTEATKKIVMASSTTTLLLSCSKSLRKRQPKITEYMKERKRLAQTPKKHFPAAKRMRLSNECGTISDSSDSNNCSSSRSNSNLNKNNIKTFFPLSRNY